MFLKLIQEGYGRTYQFDYDKFQQDPRPHILLLGKWRHPNTRNILLGGVNLNYLDEDQLQRLRQNLKKILEPRNLKMRYWRGKKLLPDIFNDNYRTYDVDYVGQVTKDTLNFYPSAAELERAEAEQAAKDATEREKELKQLELPPSTSRPQAAPPAAPAAAPAPMPAPEIPEPEVKTPEAPTPPEAPELPQAPAPKPKRTPKAAAPKPLEEPTPEPQPKAPESLGQKQPGAPPNAPKASPAGNAPLKPEVEETPAGTAPDAVEKPKKQLTSAQRRKQQARQIKKALEKTKQPPKHEPPEEFQGFLGSFHPKKK